MSTFTKQFNFGVDIENWALTTGGGTGITGQRQVLTAGTDSPNDTIDTTGVALRMTRSGKNLTDGAPYWQWSGTWEDLGVPAGATITAVNLSYDWRCFAYTTGAASTTGAAELRDSAGTTLRGTFSTALAYSATSGWATRTGTNLTGLTDASTTAIKLRINAIPKTGSSNSAVNSVEHDWIVVTVTYTPAGPQTISRTLTVAQVGSVGIVRDVTGRRAATSVVEASTVKRADAKRFPSAQAVVATLAPLKLYNKIIFVGAPPTFHQEQMADSPLAKWRLSETSGDYINLGSAGNVADLTPSGTPTRGASGLTGDGNAAVDLDGVDDTAKLTTYTTWNGWPSGLVRTYEGLAVRDTDGSIMTLIGGQDGSYGPTLRLASGSGTVTMESRYGWGTASWTAAWPGTGTVVHWVLRVDSSGGTPQAELFINGTSQGVVTGFPDFLGSGFSIGADNGARFWDGKQDEVAVYSGLLSDARIAAHNAAIVISGTGGGGGVVGFVTRRVNSSRPAAQTAAVALVKRAYLESLAAIESVAATVRRAVTRSGSAPQAEAASLIKQTAKPTAAVESSAASTQRQPAVARAAAEATLGTLTRRANSTRSASLGSSGFLGRLLSRNLSVAQTQVATLITARAYLRSLTAQITQTAAVATVKSLLRSLTASSSESAALSRRPARTASATEGSTATRSVLASRSFSALSTVVPSLTSIRAYLKSLTAQLVAGASIRRALSTARTAAQGSSATVQQSQSVTRTAQATESGSVRRAVARTTSTASPITAAIASVRAYLRSLAAVTTLSASVQRLLSTSRSTFGPSNATVQRQPRVVRSAVQISTAFVSRQLALLRTLAAATVQLASTRRSATRTTATTEPESAAAVRYTEQTTSADAPSQASTRRSVLQTVSAGASMLASLFTGGFVPELLFPLKVRVMEWVSSVKAIEAGTLVAKARETFSTVKVSEPTVSPVVQEPSTKAQADESGSMIVEVNEEGSDS